MGNHIRSEHGSALEAINFTLDVLDASDTEHRAFLKAWRMGDLKDWPEYYEWLDTLPVRG